MYGLVLPFFLFGQLRFQFSIPHRKNPVGRPGNGGIVGDDDHSAALLVGQLL